MCYANQLVLPWDDGAKWSNVALINKIKRLWAARRDIHHASAFARPMWPVITLEDPEVVQELQWGLVPSWVREPNEFLKKSPTFNAQCEGAFEKPSFRAALKTERRCLVPSSGFFEWHHAGAGKVQDKFPHYIHLKETPVMFFGGIYEKGTFSILTTAANELMSHIHNSKKRMPVILRPGEEESWIRAGLSKEDVLAMCQPLPTEMMEAWPITKRITSRTEDPNHPLVIERASYPELLPPGQPLF